MLKASASRVLLAVSLLSAALLYYFSIYELPRQQFASVLMAYAALWLSFGLIYRYGTPLFSLAQWLGMAALLRLILLLAEPNLSNDFHRFLWDGRLIAAGLNPFLRLPANVAPGTIAQMDTLLQGMGTLNATNYSCYPPLNQAAFALAGLWAPQSISSGISILRMLLILSDLLIIFIGWKMLRHLGKPGYLILLFGLNPFVIWEFAGNLHFESLMLAALLGALYLLQKRQWLFSAVLFSAAVAIKLIPLIFLPLLWRHLGFKKALGYYAVVGLTQVLFWAYFLDQALLSNFQNTLALYFQKFEFNASVYYLIREAGYRIVGHNIIGTVGKILPFVTLSGVIALSSLRSNQKFAGLLQNMMWVILLYLALTTTVHPWYLATPLLLMVFTSYRTPLLWTFMVVLSYSAYTQEVYRENLALVFFEYAVVLCFLLWELFFQSKKSWVSA